MNPKASSNSISSRQFLRRAVLAPWLLSAWAVVACGSADDARSRWPSSGGADAVSGGTSGGGGTSTPLCEGREFRCTGDRLEACESATAAYRAVATCGAGLCDAVGGQCDNCAAGVGTCDAGGKSYSACDPTGQTEATFACDVSHPFCTMAEDKPSCVECQAAQDCPPSQSECLLSACSATGSCGFQARAEGAACGKQGEGGQCDSAGQCTYCTPQEARCAGLVPEVCDAKGEWKAEPACAGADPVCFGGVCVECVAETDCPPSTNECLSVVCAGNACGYSPKAPGVECLGGTGHCDGAGQCNLCDPGAVTCNGNKPLRCGSDGRYSEGAPCEGSKPECAPETATCVQCTSASHCAPPANECLTVSCTGNACAYSPKQKGVVCAARAGTCNGAGQCHRCEPATRKCDGKVPSLCGSDGQWAAEPACVGACGGPNSGCVECTNVGHCAAPNNECLTATCDGGNKCALVPKASGVKCGASDGNATCNGAGQCNYCTPGSRTCSDKVPLVCGDNGRYAEETTCSGSAPFCSSGTCVQCTGASQCPNANPDCVDATCSANECGYSFKAQNTPCLGNTGKCNASGACFLCTPDERGCLGDTPRECNDSGRWVSDAMCGGSTPKCQSSTGSCVQCTSETHCATPSNPCLKRACGDGVCGVTARPDGTTCSVGGESGTCAAQVCKVCTTGAKRCKAGGTATPQTCGSDGQWQDEAACGGGSAICISGRCEEGWGNALRKSGWGYARAPSSSQWNLGAEMTVEYWLYYVENSTDDFRHNEMSAGLVNDGTGGGWVTVSRPDRLEFIVDYYSQAGQLKFNPSPRLAAGRWYHVAYSYDHATMRIFVDGALVASKAATFNVGYSGDGLTVLAWNRSDRALTGNFKVRELHIAADGLYTMAFTPTWTFPITSATRALYHFNQTTGTSVPDAAGVAPALAFSSNSSALSWVAAQ